MAGLRCFWHYRDLANGNPAIMRISKELSAELQESLHSEEPIGRPILLRGKTCSDLPISHVAAQAMDKICKAILCDLDHVMSTEPSSLKRKHRAAEDDDDNDAGLASLNNCPLSETASVMSLFCYEPGSGADEHEDRGLLTIIYCPSDTGLIMENGHPVVTEQDEVIILAGKALDVATGGHFPATRHAVKTQVLRRRSLVFRCRGKLNGTLVPGYSKYGRLAHAHGLGVGGPRTLAQFYREFDALYNSVNLHYSKSRWRSFPSKSTSARPRRWMTPVPILFWGRAGLFI
jgi:2OG-Fe(II) oxygenase superfamily